MSGIRSRERHMGTKIVVASGKGVANKNWGSSASI
ncbi:Bgt-51341 [Blumeria graminis f. sp. tritici]|uniref:Bgt-51341 n=1 Tax=Blumeria graminis f. sp. tritici TaxID=62690 RepID=A0A9X9MGW2_BLUGR|nr:Bgt-51341 [Blumeria graminis f. sp. tritici]